MPTRNVVLTDHQEEFLTQMVKAGHYQNASEILREGLRLIEKDFQEHLARLQSALQDGVDSGVSNKNAGEIQAITKKYLQNEANFKNRA